MMEMERKGGSKRGGRIRGRGSSRGREGEYEGDGKVVREGVQK